MSRANAKDRPIRSRPNLLLNLLLILFLSLFFLSAASSVPAQSGALTFHGNIKTKKFHRPGCRYYNCKNCVVRFATREEALRSGYIPCRVCNP